MNTAQLVEHVAKRNRLSKAKAKDVVESVLDTIQSKVAKGGKVSLSGFGTFEKGVRRARRGRNPATGEEIKIPRSRFARFRAGTSFKKALTD